MAIIILTKLPAAWDGRGTPQPMARHAAIGEEYKQTARRHRRLHALKVMHNAVAVEVAAAQI